MLGRHPTLWIALINVVVMGLATLGFGWLDNDQAGLIVVAVNAIAGAANAWAVRPIQPAVFTYAVSSIVALVGAYGLNVTADQLAALNSIAVSVLGFLTYGNVSPVDTAISKATSAQSAPEVQTVPEA
jgi:hypothetical protein